MLQGIHVLVGEDYIKQFIIQLFNSNISLGILYLFINNSFTYFVSGYFN